MADGGPNSRPGAARTHRDRRSEAAAGGEGTPVRRYGTQAGGTELPSGTKERRVRAKRPLWLRLLLVLLMVLVVGAVSFLVGYLIGTRLALLAFGLI